MELSNYDRYMDVLQPLSDLVNAKQNLMDAFQAMSDFINTKHDLPAPEIPKVEEPLQLTEPGEYSVLTEAESILKEDLDREIDRLGKALLHRYYEARQNHDWKWAHDFLLYGVVGRPYPYESDYLAKATEWIAKAENLLA